MIYLKAIITALTVFIGVFLIAMLVASFVQWDIQYANPGLWGEDVRVALLILASFLAISAGVSKL